MGASQDQSEGYLVIAFDDGRYLDLAANLALSVRRHDARPISVVINKKVTFNPAYRELFDQVIVAPDEPGIGGAMNKARLFGLTPYARSMYIDSDCLLFSPRIEFFWRKYRGHPIAVEGHKQSSGPAFGCSLGVKDAGALCRLFDVPYLTVFNSEVIYFDGSDAAKAAFDKTLAIYNGPHRDAVSYGYKHPGEYADEPFFAVALAQLGIAPFEPPLTNRLQVTTPNLVDAVLDIDTGDLRVVKQQAGGKAQLWSGVLCHFCGLAPMELYFPLADKLRAAVNLPQMERGMFQPVVLTSQHHESNVTGAIGA